MAMHPLLKDHILPLRRYALALTGNTDQSDDLVQETLARAIEGAGSWDPRRDLRKWLFGIMHNTNASALRRRALEGEVADQIGSLASEAVPPTQFTQVHFSETIASLMRLPDDQREVMVLIAVENFSYKDAAELLDIPVGTVMSRLARAREALRGSSAAAPIDVPAGNRPSLRLVR
ncbi:sigma-70 family RNA polymerase sigma factor [Skermanella mucosa]|uniref:sigma-70 family RNA polymerase sigma factor n=1 Tax=Skermanella mucosa TaxID=1789672 RepID=UPI00192B6ECA|nr:sigma-70 family RNA polymerase sigma factor [Skermanella mucosa]UEM23830.1 sigma-70 family RNA polymerase sigma factor [Skermanella mucosa]